MPPLIDINQLFTRMGEAILDHDIKIERMVWLPVIKEGDDNWRWLKDDALDADEKELKAVFGEKLGAILHECNVEDDYDEGCYTLSRHGGWLLNVSCRPPDPKGVDFGKDGKVKGYRLDCFEQLKLVYAGNLMTAVCKAILWQHRVERKAIAKARELLAEKKKKKPKAK